MPAASPRYGNALHQTTGSTTARTHIVLNAIRVPLGDFKAQGVDLDEHPQGRAALRRCRPAGHRARSSSPTSASRRPSAGRRSTPTSSPTSRSTAPTAPAARRIAAATSAARCGRREDGGRDDDRDDDSDDGNDRVHRGDDDHLGQGDTRQARREGRRRLRHECQRRDREGRQGQQEQGRAGEDRRVGLDGEHQARQGPLQGDGRAASRSWSPSGSATRTALRSSHGGGGQLAAPLCVQPSGAAGLSRHTISVPGPSGSATRWSSDMPSAPSDGDGGVVALVDEGGHVRELQVRERGLERGATRLGRVAVAPGRGIQAPADLDLVRVRREPRGWQTPVKPTIRPSASTAHRPKP